MKHFFSISILCLVLQSSILQAQNSTFEKLHTIFKANCTTGCHSGDNPAAKLDLTGSLDEVHGRLINVDPVNPYAKESGFKLVYPGFADKSVLFRKCNNNLYHTAKLAPEEGQTMPIDQDALSSVEIEIIRKWIYEGAPKDKIVDNEALIKQYYEEGGLPRLERPAAPSPEEGFQLYFGTLFLAPGDEIEVVKKVQLNLGEQLEVDRIELFMDKFSHHLIVSKFSEEDSKNYPNEIQTIGSVGDQISHLITSEFVAITQTEYLNLELPEKTAFSWRTGTDLTINYHVKNYSQSSVFPGEVYVNIYTQDVGVAEREMKSTLHIYGNNNPFSLNIDNSGNDVTFSMERNFNAVWDIWIVQGHTHQLGVDYDMFLRNEDGSKGEQIYEGYYDLDYTFNQGFFDYEHPPVRRFEPLLNVDMNKGLIYEATYNNEGEKPVGFGLTTNDEMFITYMLYTRGELTSVEEHTPLTDVNSIQVFPNPFSNEAIIQYNLSKTTEVDLALFNLMGQKVVQLQKAVLPADEHTTTINKHTLELETGVYLLRLNAGGESSEQKIIVY